MPGLSLRERALRHLARREHSRAELARKLAPYGSAEEIDEVLNRMHELELQSDRRFAEAWVRGRAARFGLARLRHDLAARGIDTDVAAAALAAEAGDELERARRVWATRFDAVPSDAREWARQARFLQARGFRSELVRRVLKEMPDESA